MSGMGLHMFLSLSVLWQIIDEGLSIPDPTLEEDEPPEPEPEPEIGKQDSLCHQLS